MKLRYTIDIDIDTDDIEDLGEAENQFNFCLKHQSEKDFVIDLINDKHSDVEVMSIEEV